MYSQKLFEKFLRLKNIAFETVQVVFKQFQSILWLGFSILKYSQKCFESLIENKNYLYLNAFLSNLKRFGNSGFPFFHIHANFLKNL